MADPRTYITTRAAIMYGPGPLSKIARAIGKTPMAVTGYLRRWGSHIPFWSAILVCPAGDVGTDRMLSDIPLLLSPGEKARAGRIAACLYQSSDRFDSPAQVPFVDMTALRAALESDADTDSLVARLPGPWRRPRITP